MTADTNKHSKPDAALAAIRYVLIMLLQRLEGTGQIDLKEIIAGVQADEQASTGASPLIQETFLETLKLLKFAQRRG